MAAPISFSQAPRQFPQNRHKLGFGLRGERPDDGGDVPVALGYPSRPCARVVDGNVVAPALMEQGHGNGNLTLAGHVDDRVDVSEICLIGCERIVADEGLLSVDVRCAAVPCPTSLLAQRQSQWFSTFLGSG